MMRIGLLGLSDKRHIVYTLIRVLGGIGRTIFFSPNKQYLMLSPDHLREFEIADVQIVVYDCDITDLDEEYETEMYEYVIYDVLTDLPDRLDTVLMTDSHEFYMYDLEDADMDNIPVFTSCAVEKGNLLPKEKLIKLPMASFVEPALQKMFDEQTLYPINNGLFVKGMTPVVAEMTSLPAKQVTARLRKGDMKA